MNTFKPGDYLASYDKAPACNFKDTYGSELLKGEMEKMSMKRYQLEAPSEDAGADGFAEAVKNGQAQVQHQSVRIENLDLMSEHGPMACRMYNTTIEAMHASVKANLEATTAEIETVNKKRKLDQTMGGHKVRELELHYDELTRKNINIDAACQSLDRDIRHLKGEEVAV